VVHVLVSAAERRDVSRGATLSEIYSSDQPDATLPPAVGTEESVEQMALVTVLKAHGAA
jgi:hypothetical protein